MAETNGDFIRSMSDEKLAMLFAMFEMDKVDKVSRAIADTQGQKTVILLNSAYPATYISILQWLKSDK